MLSRDEALQWDEILQSEGLISYEDAMTCDCISLDDAGLADDGEYAPIFVVSDNIKSVQRFMSRDHCSGSVYEMVQWLMDGEDSRYEDN